MISVARSLDAGERIELLSVWVLSAVLVFSGIDKMFHYDGFQAALRDYSILPLTVARYIGSPLIAAEIFIGVSLFSRRWRRHASVAGGALFLIFNMALIGNYFLGGRGICGCWFTVTLAQGTLAHVVQNLMLAMLSFSLCIHSRGENK